MHQIRLG